MKVFEYDDKIVFETEVTEPELSPQKREVKEYEGLTEREKIADKIRKEIGETIRSSLDRFIDQPMSPLLISNIKAQVAGTLNQYHALQRIYNFEVGDVDENGNLEVRIQPFFSVYPIIETNIKIN
jgi:hypothetical protein